MRWERVTLQAEGADPQFASDVDLAVRVEDASARLARDGFVQDGWQVGTFFQRCVELLYESIVSEGTASSSSNRETDGGDGDDCPRALYPTASKHVPRESYAVTIFYVFVIERLSLRWWWCRTALLLHVLWLLLLLLLHVLLLLLTI